MPDARTSSGEQFGEQRLIDTIEHISLQTSGVTHLVRRLSTDLKRQRGGVTSDDTTLLIIEWHSGTADHLAVSDL